MTGDSFGFWMAVFIISITKSEAARFTASKVCPMTVLAYATEGKLCNRSLEELKWSVNSLTDGKQGCNSSCKAYFNYKANDVKLYDIHQTRITVFNKIRNATWVFDVDCEKVENNSRRILSITCDEVEYDAYYYQRWCRNTSDCLKGQECNMFGDLGVCSRTCKNDTLIENKFHQSEFGGSTALPVQILHNGFKVGHVVVAAIGGFVLGLAVCVVSVIGILKNRKSVKQKSRKDEVHLATDKSCKTDLKISITKGVNGPAENKESSGEPLSESNEEYSTFTNTNPNGEGIYNHLNEKKEERDLDDYDHAHLTAAENVHY